MKVEDAFDLDFKGSRSHGNSIPGGGTADTKAWRRKSLACRRKREASVAGKE